MLLKKGVDKVPFSSRIIVDRQTCPPPRQNACEHCVMRAICVERTQLGLHIMCEYPDFADAMRVVEIDQQTLTRLHVTKED